ncbi:EamA family transporter [Amycolatopsis tucumanensis]|uniref:EamA family transporter n=1 Tax=Amycolatopsis tucumanensis TaxID=401106 RepID=UPI0035573CEF
MRTAETGRHSIPGGNLEAMISGHPTGHDVTTPTRRGKRSGPRPGRMLAVVLAWASCFVLIRWGLRDSPVLWFAALRAVIAGIALLGAAALSSRTQAPKPVPRDTTTWLLIGVLALLNVTVAFGAMAASTTGVTTGVASVLANTPRPNHWLPSRTCCNCAATSTPCSGKASTIPPAEPMSPRPSQDCPTCCPSRDLACCYRRCGMPSPPRWSRWTTFPRSSSPTAWRSSSTPSTATRSPSRSGSAAPTSRGWAIRSRWITQTCRR